VLLELELEVELLELELELVALELLELATLEVELELELATLELELLELAVLVVVIEIDALLGVPKVAPLAPTIHSEKYLPPVPELLIGMLMVFAVASPLFQRNMPALLV
jgi:hypothetical protein